MTPIPEKHEEPELVDIVLSLRQRIEQLEETVHDLLTGQDELRDSLKEARRWITHGRRLG